MFKLWPIRYKQESILKEQQDVLHHFHLPGSRNTDMVAGRAAAFSECSEKCKLRRAEKTIGGTQVTGQTEDCPTPRLTGLPLLE